MKKIISLSLALAVIFSLVGILPAEAKLYADYPFVYEPFEEDNLANQQVEGLISSGGGTSFRRRRRKQGKHKCYRNGEFFAYEVPG